MKQNFIELITVPFNAGESKLFAISGQYFELIDATNPVDVLLSEVNGAQRGVMRSAEASFNLKDTDFATVQLYSATAQTIRFAYGTGEAGTRRAAGAVSIVGTVPVSGPLTDAQLRATPVVVNGRPSAPTGNWVNQILVAANTAINVFTGASNVNGAIVWAAGANDQNAAGTPQSFLAKATAPASIVDGDVIAMTKNQILSSAPMFYKELELVQPQFIPAGLGLWFISAFAGSAVGYRYARFQLL